MKTHRYHEYDIQHTYDLGYHYCLSIEGDGWMAFKRFSTELFSFTPTRTLQELKKAISIKKSQGSDRFWGKSEGELAYRRLSK